MYMQERTDGQPTLNREKVQSDTFCYSGRPADRNQNCKKSAYDSQDVLLHFVWSSALVPTLADRHFLTARSGADMLYPGTENFPCQSRVGPVFSPAEERLGKACGHAEDPSA